MRRPFRFRATTEVLALGLAFALAGPAWADDTATPSGMIVVDTAAPWTHTPTGVVLPPSLGPFVRTTLSQSSANLVDVSIGYNDNTSQTTLTVYVFRAGWPQASLWADRLSQAMAGTVERLGGKLAGEPRFAAFTPSDHASASALRVVQATEGGSIRSTGAVVIPADPWLVTMRMSSNALAPGELDAALLKAATALTVPAPKTPLPAAVVLAACPDALGFKPAQRGKRDMQHAILAATLIVTAEEDPTKADAQPATAPALCRDPSSDRTRGIYRIPGEADRYVIGIGDAGVTAEVAPNPVSGELKRPAIDLTLTMFERKMVFTPFKSTPTVDQVLQAVQHDRPEAVVTDGQNIEIVP
jgi:hypothetical protein